MVIKDPSLLLLVTGMRLVKLLTMYLITRHGLSIFMSMRYYGPYQSIANLLEAECGNNLLKENLEVFHLTWVDNVFIVFLGNVRS